MIHYGLGTTPLGTAFVARTDRGVCGLYLLSDEDPSPALARLRQEHGGDDHLADGGAVAPILRRVRGWFNGDGDLDGIPLDLRGTPFQQRVWDALRTIPAGSTRSYGELARQIGLPRAARAVGAACGRNPVALLVPCHRAVRHDGDPGGYHWGLDRKRALLEREQGRPA
jgi:AraC family transcriptional regulator, regulatory protein of adaptative response / methylated-DNA-[protein]-cysteine methyltransferase